MIIIELNGNTYSKRKAVRDDRCDRCAFKHIDKCGGTCHRSTMFPKGAIYKRHYTASELANNLRNK